MKNLDELSYEELIKIVSYKGTKGTILFYDKISSITETNLVYDGDTISGTDNPKAFAEIKAGKMKYEMYKLANSNERIDILIKEKSEELLKKYFNDSFEDIADEFQDRTSNLVKSLQNKINEFSSTISEQSQKSDLYIDKSAAAIKELKESEKILKDFLKSQDIEDLKDTVIEKVQSLEPIQKRFNKVVSSLEELFNNK